ncbi:uncharacterized protein LOC143027942 [Oratosquilla oratoria]|uniref:uncharacterized protein LOC143027942 n=1 Tax=Oratosquilla oratoria TaxID=337810 RepID=UPI003F759681
MSSEEIISAVFQRREVWDPVDPLHKNVGALRKCWDDISKKLNITEKAAKGKWKNLRDYYRQELRKQSSKRSGAGADDVGTSTWPYFRQMSFLKDILNPDSRNSNLTHDETASVLDEEDVNVEYGHETQFSEASHYEESVPPSPRPSSPPNIPYTTASGPSTSREFNARQIIKRLPPRLEYINKKNDELIAIEKRKLELLENEQKDTEDEDLHFFKSITPYMKKLPGIKRLRVRTQMQNLLLQELEQLENYTHTSGPTSPVSDSS